MGKYSTEKTGLAIIEINADSKGYGASEIIIKDAESIEDIITLQKHLPNNFRNIKVISETKAVGEQLSYFTDHWMTSYYSLESIEALDAADYVEAQL